MLAHARRPQVVGHGPVFPGQRGPGFAGRDLTVAAVATLPGDYTCVAADKGTRL